MAIIDNREVGYGIVILNYRAYWETIQCITSIAIMNNKPEQIIIVDNSSPNESYKILKETYRTVENIHVIKSKENGGYARGNNFGIEYIRRKYELDYILLLNSDVKIIQRDFIDKLISAAGKNAGAVGSVMYNPSYVITENGFYDYSITYMLKEIISNIGALANISIKANEHDHSEGNKYIIGCAVLLTPIYFKYYRGLFNQTFMYREETILDILCRKVGLQTIVAEDAMIYHAEYKSSSISDRLLSDKVKKRNLHNSLCVFYSRVLPYQIIKFFCG